LQKMQYATGSMDCTNSLTMPPKKKHTMAVKISPACRQNHIRLESLTEPSLLEREETQILMANILFNVEYEIEHCSCDTETDKV